MQTYLDTTSESGVYSSLVTFPDHTWDKLPAVEQRRILRVHTVHLLYSGKSEHTDSLLCGIEKMDSPELRALIPFSAPRQGNCESFFTIFDIELI